MTIDVRVLTGEVVSPITDGYANGVEASSANFLKVRLGDPRRPMYVQATLAFSFAEGVAKGRFVYRHDIEAFPKRKRLSIDFF